MNVELLKKVRDAIADVKNPVGFDMEAWAPAGSDCGTACCIAGHVVLAAGEEVPKQHSVADRAAALLFGDYSFGADDHLFYGYWSDAALDEITRAEAVAYLDKCIAAGEIVRVS